MNSLSVVSGRELICREGRVAYVGINVLDKLSKVFQLVVKIIKRARHTDMTMARR